MATKIQKANALLLPEVAKMVAQGLRVTLRVKGNSMLPFIVGDRDSVVFGQFESLRVGDIVLAEVESLKFVVHRIIEISGESVVLMGDGNIRGVEKCSVVDVKALALSVITPAKEWDCTTDKHLRQARIWHQLLPLRRYILAIYRRVCIRK